MRWRIFGQTVDISTVVELLRWRAEELPDRRAYTYLIDGETEEAHVTYGELDRQARSIATLLQSAGATGQRALLCTHLVLSSSPGSSAAYTPA